MSGGNESARPRDAAQPCFLRLPPRPGSMIEHSPGQSSGFRSVRVPLRAVVLTDDVKCTRLARAHDGICPGLCPGRGWGVDAGAVDGLGGGGGGGKV